MGVTWNSTLGKFITYQPQKGLKGCGYNYAAGQQQQVTIKTQTTNAYIPSTTKILKILP